MDLILIIVLADYHNEHIGSTLAQLSPSQFTYAIFPMENPLESNHV